MKRFNHHRGDSLSKKISRYEFYMRLRAWFGSEEFKQKTFCYLASFEGGDASVLGALGVPKENQLAVDFDPDALARFASKYPGVPVHCGPVESIENKKFDVVFLDLCSNLTMRVIDICAKAAQMSCGHGAIFAYAIQRGREHKATMQRIRFTRDDHRRGEEYEGHLGRVSDGRSQLAVEGVFGASKRRQLLPLSLGKIIYQSVDPEELEDGKPGTPMMIHVLVMTTSNFPKEAIALREQHEVDMTCVYGVAQKYHHRDYRGPAAEIKSIMKSGLVLGTISKRSGETRFSGGVWLESIVRTFANGRGFFFDLVGFEDKAILAESIEDAVRHGIDPSLALNLDKGTVSALRAHRTRGSYLSRVAAIAKETIGVMENSEDCPDSIVRLGL